MAFDLVTNLLGTFVLKDGKVVLQTRHPKDISTIVSELKLTREDVAESEKKILQELSDTGNKELFVDDPRRFRSLDLPIEFKKSKVRISVNEIAAKISVEPVELEKIMFEVNQELVRSQMKLVDDDQLIIQAVESLNDMDEAVNRLVERLREWYSLHFPELDPLITSHDLYATLVLDIGYRKDFAEKNLGLDDSHSEKIINASKNSLGVDFSKNDMDAVGKLAQPISDLFERKQDIEEYIGSKMEELAPNLTDLVGPLLGARLISLAHGMKRLSTLPASTIQVLGAEDAFFRFLKTGDRPPKHGIIFQHPAIRGATREVRGKLSRTLAAKIAIASRGDVYGGDVSEKLKKDFEKRVSSLVKKT